MRRRLADWLHKWGDRIDDDSAYRVTSLTFTFEVGRGAVLRTDGRGCRILYRGHDDYARAHTESDTHPPTFADLMRMLEP